jgi:hypothetical protein
MRFLHYHRTKEYMEYLCSTDVETTESINRVLLHDGDGVLRSGQRRWPQKCGLQFSGVGEILGAGREDGTVAKCYMNSDWLASAM